MENNQFFAGTPVLTLITNFSNNGNFEKIYMVMGHLPEKTASNQMRNNTQSKKRGFWNGPLNRTQGEK